MKKWRIKLVSGVAVCGMIALAAVLASNWSGTLSYLTDSEATDNLILAGEAQIEITETFPPIGQPPEPGESIVKVVRIRNTGNLQCYVRAFLAFEDNKLAELIEPFEIGSGWQRKEDGYYYYKEAVDPGEETKPLITALKVRTRKEDGTEVTEEEIAEISAGLIVYSEALGFGTGNLPEAGNVPQIWEKYCASGA